MKFGPLQRDYFEADDGAYSIVTEDERKKGQITLTETDGESNVAIYALGEANIPRKAAQKRPLEVYVFRSTGAPELAALTINFPKDKRNELRIYRKALAGFGYNAGDVWFVFRRGHRLYVGAMPEPRWRSLGRKDLEDASYIALSAGETLPLPTEPRSTTVLQYQRDPALARRRFEMAKYKCEFDPAHRLFKARSTGLPFLEPHHLVMVSLQKQFASKSLDFSENIFALCPWCHRAVHHAEYPLVREILGKLVERRPQVCERLSLSRNDILRLYNCESIKK